MKRKKMPSAIALVRAVPVVSVARRRALTSSARVRFNARAEKNDAEQAIKLARALSLSKTAFGRLVSLTIDFRRFDTTKVNTAVRFFQSFAPSFCVVDDCAIFDVDDQTAVFLFVLKCQDEDDHEDDEI